MKKNTKEKTYSGKCDVLLLYTEIEVESKTFLFGFTPYKNAKLCVRKKLKNFKKVLAF